MSLATPGDYAEVEALSRAADPSEMTAPLTADLIRWFIDLNPSGPGFLVLTREARSDRVLGYFLFYPKPLCACPGGGRVPVTVPAYLFVRLYVAADYRRRGVFARMTAFGFEVLRQAGVPFAYTVPNQRSAPGFLKVGMQSLGRLRVRARPAWTLWPAPNRRGVSIRPRERFDASLDALVGARCPPQASVCGVRSAALLNWRYVDRPDAEYRIRDLLENGRMSGYVVTRTMQIMKYRALAVCDFWHMPGMAPAVAPAIAAALREEAAGSVDVVLTIAGLPGRASRGAWWRAGFLPVPHPALPQPAVVIGGRLQPSAESPALPGTDRWYMTPFDWDVF